VHAGAHFRLGGPRAPYFRTNVDGTTALLKAAEQAGAKAFVYISAAGLIMDDRGTPIRNADEKAPTHPNSFSPYLASKSRAEAAVLAANKPGFRTIALRPPGIWGPGDMFSRELPRAIASGQFAFIDGGNYPYATCHVDNVVEAAQRALERGEGGRAYFINDQSTQTFREFISMIASLQGLSVDKLRSTPYRLAFTIGRAMEFFAAITPQEGRSTSFALDGADDRTAVYHLRCRRPARAGYIGKISRADGLRLYREASAGAADLQGGL
jgi:nucleoside-diphosphate-sugar epimerase